MLVAGRDGISAGYATGGPSVEGGLRFPHHTTEPVLEPRRADPQARYFGAALDDRGLNPGDNPRVGPTRFEDWLGRMVRQA